MRHLGQLAGPAHQSAHLSAQRSECPWGLEYREIVAGLGLGAKGHLAAVAGYNAAQEALCLLAKTLSPPGACLPTGIGLFAVPAQAYLAHNALEQCLDIVVQRSRCLNKLAVEDHGAGPALWCR